MRDQIWYTLLDAERLARYYERLGSRYQRLHFYLNVAVTICSFIAAVVLLVDWYAWISAGLFLAVSGGVTWAIFADYSKKATLADHAASECADLAIELKALWRDEDASDSSERVTELEKRLNRVTRVGIGVDHRLNERCAEEAYESAKAEFYRTEGLWDAASSQQSATSAAT